MRTANKPHTILVFIAPYKHKFMQIYTHTRNTMYIIRVLDMYTFVHAMVLHASSFYCIITIPRKIYYQWQQILHTYLFFPSNTHATLEQPFEARREILCMIKVYEYTYIYSVASAFHWSLFNMSMNFNEIRKGRNVI